MIIDAHTHGMHGKYLDGMLTAGGKWAKERVAWAMKQASKKPQFTDIGLRVQQLDRYQYDLQVVTPQWTFDSNLLPGTASARLAYAKALNDNMTRMMAESKGRLLCIGNVPLEDYEKNGRPEMERAIKTLGLKGVFVSTNFRGKPIDLPEFEPFWSQASEMGIPVLIHPGDATSSECRPYEDEYDLMHNFGWPFETQLMLARLVFSGIMERYPNLKVVSHHLGGGIPFFWGRTSETYSDRLEDKIGHSLPKPLFDYFSLFYYDTAIGGSPAAIRCTYEVFGVDRIIFATDAPFGPGSGEMRIATYPKMVRAVGLSEAENKKIFADNTIKLFNI